VDFTAGFRAGDEDLEGAVEGWIADGAGLWCFGGSEHIIAHLLLNALLLNPKGREGCEAA
jgi:hypothetical protein